MFKSNTTVHFENCEIELYKGMKKILLLQLAFAELR